MNESSFKRFGFVVMAFRCLMAFGTIAKLASAIEMKNRLTSPIREWLSEIMFYSVVVSIFVLTVSVVELVDFTERISQFKKTSLPGHKVIQKSYMIISALEVIVVICFCACLQYTLQTVSTEVKSILDTGLGRYLTNTAWQTFWDQFQQHYSCCGNLQSTDWFQTAWASPVLSSICLLKKYTQENGKFIVPAAPSSCCLPDTICNTFIDCEQPDTNKYYPKGCFSVVADTINSIASIRYFFNAIIIIQIISAITKFEGYTEDGNSKYKS